MRHLLVPGSIDAERVSHGEESARRGMGETKPEVKIDLLSGWIAYRQWTSRL